MRFSILGCLFVSFLWIHSTPLYATHTATPQEFTEPAEFCFPKTTIRSKLGDFSNVILDHHIIVREEDQFRYGDIFVGLRRKTQPDVLWLTDGTSWADAFDSNQTPKAYPVMLPYGNGTLQPVMHATLSNEPIDVRSLIGDSEIWMGYGLREEFENSKASFDDMVAHQRYELVWDITGPAPHSGLPGLSTAICFVVTQMKEIIHTVNTQ